MFSVFPRFRSDGATFTKDLTISGVHVLQGPSLPEMPIEGSGGALGFRVLGAGGEEKNFGENATYLEGQGT